MHYIICLETEIIQQTEVQNEFDNFYIPIIASIVMHEASISLANSLTA
jgi:hypothetical protein